MPHGGERRIAGDECLQLGGQLAQVEVEGLDEAVAEEAEDDESSDESTCVSSACAVGRVM